MLRKRSKPASRLPAANRKHLAKTQAQFKKIESRLTAGGHSETRRMVLVK